MNWYRSIKYAALAREILKQRNEEIPDVLFHATQKENLPLIQKEGLIPGKKPNWDFSSREYIYLASEPHISEMYAVNFEDIVVFRINIKDIDLNKLYTDPHGAGTPGMFAYKGVIPPNRLTLIEGRNYFAKNNKNYKLAENVIIRNPQSVGKSYLGIGHPDYAQYENKKDHWIWYWDGDNIHKEKANWTNTHDTIWEGKHASYFFGRYDRKGEQKQVSVHLPYGWDKNKQLPPALLFELEEEFGKNLTIYLF